MMQQKVYVIDNDGAVRDSIKELVESVGLVCEAHSSAQSFLDVRSADQRGCLVLDIRMPKMSGLELQAKLNGLASALPIIFVTGHGDVQMAVGALKAGAVDFIQKPYHEQNLIDAINSALREEEDGYNKSVKVADYNKMLETLTAREREVLELVLENKSSKVIAKELTISHRTVEVHRQKVLNKFGVSSAAELIQFSSQK